MKDLNYRQHTQYLQFLSELEKCKTQEEIDRLKEKILFDRRVCIFDGASAGARERGIILLQDEAGA